MEGTYNMQENASYVLDQMGLLAKIDFYDIEDMKKIEFEKKGLTLHLCMPWETFILTKCKQIFPH